MPAVVAFKKSTDVPRLTVLYLSLDLRTTDRNRMPPKKKNNKMVDEWESELGESVDPVAAATQAAKEEDTEKNGEEEEPFGGGGLMAAMRKNRNKRKNKGKAVDDFLDGEDPPELEPRVPEPDLTVKVPEEATMDEEFALPEKKGKVKGAANSTTKLEKEEKVDDGDEERGADGKLLSKKEKEKLRKEREKQRKKEQVSITL
jgi:translation initiation factor 5B